MPKKYYELKAELKIKEVQIRQRAELCAVFGCGKKKLIRLLKEHDEIYVRLSEQEKKLKEKEKCEH